MFSLRFVTSRMNPCRNSGLSTHTAHRASAHDGFSLADLTAYEQRHNHANGEDNRDGHGENLSWNNGVEGRSEDPDINAARRRDIKALLSTLFLSRGTIMLTAGDEFGRTQQGNNNAYAQDNEITWIDWEGRDREIEAHSVILAAVRAASSALRSTHVLKDNDIAWLRPDGDRMTVADWEAAHGDMLAFKLLPDGPFVCLNRSAHSVHFQIDGCPVSVGPRSVEIIT